MEEEGRLDDSDLRESFLVRIFAHRRWREMRRAGPTPADLVRFHTAHEMLLLAHDDARYRKLGRLVAAAGEGPLDERLDAYRALMMEALSTPAPAQRHVNVIRHLSGFVKDRLDGEDRAELRTSLQEYRRGRVPLIAPLTLLGHHLRKTDRPWVREQVYLQPYPRELALRSFY